MKLKNKYSRSFINMCGFIVLCCLMLSACSSVDIKKNDKSIALIKNSSMSTYGTGFAIGDFGKNVDTIVTAYSVVASPNGAVPKTAEVRINESEKKLLANVIFYDVSRNIAVLKLAEASKELRPMIFNENINHNQNIYVRGYDGTGNILSNFEDFNITDIIQYSGNVSAIDDINSMVIYSYSNEFNRALVGAPAINEHGSVIGMCAYSLNGMNTYSQYILSSEEIIKCLISENIRFITADEVKYINIIFATLIIGSVFLLTIIIFTIVLLKRKKATPKLKNRYIKITDGLLKDKVYKFDGKISIGTDPVKCDIIYPVTETKISALHCTVQMHDGDYYLVDNFSKHGTFLADGTIVKSSTPYKIENKKFAFYIAEPKNKFEFIDKKEF